MKLFEKPNIISDWKQVLLPLLFLLFCAGVFIQFLKYHEVRIDESGWTWEDPVLSFLPSEDVSLLIFSLTYGSVLIYLFLNFKHANRIGYLMMTYGYLLLFRMLTMSLVPLKEPVDLVFLQDPFLNNLIYPGKIDTDLFFSGHAGLLFSMFFLNMRHWFYLVLVAVLGVLLMIQRVHYSIDILGAIPFAYLSAFLAKRTFEKYNTKFLGNIT